MKLPTKNFSSYSGFDQLIKQQFLAEGQIASWNWFVKAGLKELFEEISPIKDHSGESLEIYFSDYHFDEPKYDEETAQFKDLTYEAALRVKVKLVNLLTKKPMRRKCIWAIFR